MLVLALGMVIGSDGLSLIDFGTEADDYEPAQSAAIIALALILYEGGLSSGWAEIKPVIRVSVLLATVGTMITAGLTAIAALFLFTELSTLEALMLGSTVAATDAAAVFAVLRGSTLRRRLARTLEGESGVNDPVAVLLVIGCIEAFKHDDFGLARRAHPRRRGARDRRGDRARGRLPRHDPAAPGDAPVGRPVPGRVDRVRGHRLRRRRRPSTAPASSPSSSPAW